MSDLFTIAQTITSALPALEAGAASAADTTAAITANGYLGIGKGIAYGAAAAGACIGISLVVAATLNGIARQPEQAGALRGLMFLGIGFIEALALIGFVLVFIIK
jgi:F-type H+-transporting ATPase subunit c